MEEGEAVMEEAVDTLGEEVDMVEEETVMEEGVARCKSGFTSSLCQIHHLLLHTFFLDHTLSPHYTLSTAPSPPPHPHTLSPHYVLSPPYTSSLTGTRREAAVTDACDLGPDIVHS